MTLDELRRQLASVRDSFTLTANAIGVDTVASLFTTYLPDGTLTVHSAAANAETLTVAGRMTLGDVHDAEVLVAFVVNAAGTEVSGIRITLALAGWSVDAPPIHFNAGMADHFLESPELTLQAGGNDVELAKPCALLGGSRPLETREGTKRVTLRGSLPVTTADRPPPNVVLEVRPDGLTLGDLAALTQLVPGGQFNNVIPTEIPVADALSLSELELVVNPADGNLLSLCVAVTSAKTLVIAPGKFEIDKFTFTFYVLTPTRSPDVYTSVHARMELGGEIVDVELALPDLFLTGSLSRKTPLKLKPFLGHFFTADFIPDDFELSGFAFGINLKTPYFYGFHIDLENLWSIKLTDTRTLDFTRLLVFVDAAGVAALPDVSVRCRFQLADTHLYLSAVEKAGDWSFSGGTDGYQTINFVPLARDLARLFGAADVPDALTALDLHRIELTFDTKDKHFTFVTAGSLAVSDVSVDATLNIDLKPAQGDHPFTAEVHGTLDLTAGETTVGFDVLVKKEGSKTLLTGTMNAEQTPLELNDLLNGLGFKADIPDGLDIALQDFGVLYEAEVDETTHTTTSTFIVTAQSKTYGKTLLIVRKVAGGESPATTYVFAVAPALHGSLSQLPLIGQDVPPSLDLALEGLQVLIASRALSEGDVSELNELLERLAKQLPELEWTLGTGAHATKVELTVSLRLGESPTTFTLPFGKHTKAITTTAVAADSDQATWLSVQKSLGPLFFRRIGFAYVTDTSDQGELEVLLDASLSFSAVAISLDGLSVRSPLTGFHPSFGLRGMGLSLKTAALEVTGAFLSMKPGGLKDPDFEYGGQVVIRAATFAISGIGAYGKFGGHPSFFIFASLDAPLGGPPFFFVTGLAAGFGYNRSLEIPALDDVPSFPLVQAAMARETGKDPFAGKAEDPGAALAVMDRYLPVAIGENWLAVGVRFRSFEMIQSFALLSIAFGTRFEVALIGLSTMAVPTGATEPIGYAELALVASFSPDDGVLAAAAQLTSASYVLAKACHLTGGFAFSLWFKSQTNVPNGPSAGEFVVSLGGYYPGFDTPPLYPTVPRLGANWKVDDCLSVKGGVYFALTASSVMAGGALAATWKSGNLAAWFDCSADFLLSWKPFHYRASLSLSLGASYRADLGVTSQTFTVHAGAALELWGPPFAGRAHVDLDIVSFTIAFGAEPTPIEPISWADFKTSFLPPDEPSRVRAVRARAADSAPAATETYCSTQVAAGLVSDLSKRKLRPQDPDWVVDPGRFRLVTQSVVPSTRATLVSGTSPAHPNAETPIAGDFPLTFGIGPVGIADGALDSEHRITIHRLTGDTVDHAYTVRDRCRLEPVTGNLPGAPWSKTLSLDLVRNPSISVVNAAPRTINDLVVGFAIVPDVRAPGSTPEPIDLAALQESPAPERPSFAWAAPSIPTTDAFDPAAAFATFQSSLADREVSDARDAILAALIAQGVAVDAKVDVSHLAESADRVLLHAPWLQHLGEARRP